MKFLVVAEPNGNHSQFNFIIGSKWHNFYSFLANLMSWPVKIGTYCLCFKTIATGEDDMG